MSSPKWTTVTDIDAKVRRQWKNGSLLRSFVADTPFPTIEVPLRGPKQRDVAEKLDAARHWVAQLAAGESKGYYRLIQGAIGGKEVGRNPIPKRAVIESYSQAWKLLSVADSVAKFGEVLSSSSRRQSAHNWVLDHPLAAIDLAEKWSLILAAADWLEWNRDSGMYLRQVNEPGIDTKFIEGHLPILAELLGVPKRKTAFEATLGLSSKPTLVRFRIEPGTLSLPVSEASLRPSEINKLPGSVTKVLIVENEVTYLAAPVPAGGLVIWGRGYDAPTLGTVTLLQDCQIDYWGDLDTHGFAILSALRSVFPQTRSVLMDRRTLLAHQDRWGVEPKQHVGVTGYLEPSEQSLYEDLLSGSLRTNLRLEQERIDWDWALQELGH